MAAFSLKTLFSYGSIVLLQKFVGFFMVPIIAGYLSVSDFGKLNQLLSLNGLYVLIILLGIDEALVKKIFSNIDSAIDYIKAGLVAVLFNFVIFLIIVLFSQKITYSNYVQDIDLNLIAVSLIFIISNSFFIIFQKQFRILKRVRSFSIVTLTLLFIQMISTIVLIVYFELGALGVLIGYTSANLISLLIAIYLYIKKKKVDKSFNVEHMKSLYAYGSKVAPHTIASWGMFGLLVVFVGTSLGSVDAAEFVSTNYLALICTVASYAFFYTYQPWLYDALSTGYPEKKILLKIIMFILLFVVLVTLVYICSNFIYELIFDERYSLDKFLAMLLLIGAFIQFCSSIFTYVLYYFEDKTKYVSVSTLLGLTLNILILLYLSFYSPGDLNLYTVAFSFIISQSLVFLIRVSVSVSCLIQKRKGVSVE